MTADIATYYQKRAPEYDRLYEKPDRQNALQKASAILQDILAKKKVLEIASGTGYWTEQIAKTAQTVHATDINQSMLDIARQRPYPSGNVSFDRCDLYDLSFQNYDALFGGFIWSHIPVQELASFIDKVNSLAAPGGMVVFMDNLYVEGSNTPIVETDEFGNTSQDRPLADGSKLRIIKNFPSAEFLQKSIEGKGTLIEVLEIEFYWIFSYRTISK